MRANGKHFLLLLICSILGAQVVNMRTWNTNDGATNSNLSYLESLGEVWAGMTAEQLAGKVEGVASVQRMLPNAVRRHFKIPYFFVGSDTTGWTENRVQERAEELREAIHFGLAQVATDASLAKDGCADLSDRPATKGEEIRAALDAYQESRGTTERWNLWTAVSGTRLRHYMEKVDKWLGRKRPSHRDRSIEYEIVCALGDIGRRVDEYHWMPASYDFQHRRDSHGGRPA